MIITSICTTCLLCLYQPFMHIWMKDQNLILSNTCVICFCIYFYEINMNNTINLYLNGNGLYWNLRYYYIIETLMNLLLNIILGKLLGIFGILVATIITLLLFNFIPRVVIVFKYYFNRSAKEYYFNNFKYFAFCILVSTLLLFIISFISINGIIVFLLKGFLVLMLSSIFYYIIYKNNSYFISIRNISKLFNRKKVRKDKNLLSL